MAAILLGDKRLSDLKVTELKAELDKRGLSKKGVKSVLVERLKKAILQEELSNVNDEEDDDSGPEISAEASLLQDGATEYPGDGVGGAESAVPAGDAVRPEGTSVDPDDPSPSTEPLPPEVTSDSAAAVEAPVVDSTAEDEPQTAPVADQPNDETNEEQAADIESVAMDTEDSVVASDEEGREVEEEEEGKKSQSNQPMDLGSPLDSDPEFDLLPGEQDDSMDMTGKEGGGDGVSGAKETANLENQASEEAPEDGGDKEEEEKGEDEEVKKEETEEKKEESEEAVNEGGQKRIERLDSTFDSSYEPATEELLYEGDPETEVKHETSEEQADADKGEKSTPQKKDGEEEGDKPADTSVTTERREEDEGFMVEVHYKDPGESSLIDPAATVIGPAHSSSSSSEPRGKGGKASLIAAGGKTPGDSNRLQGCHLWVAGLVSSVRALDLQTLFSSFGQVVSAKVVAKAQSKARFGYVTLATREQAQKCIAELNGTELKGSTIHVELAKTAPPLSHASPGEGKTPSHRSVSSTGPRGKEGGAKNAHDSREKDKASQSVARKSPGGGGGGEGKGGTKPGDRGRDERRRSSGSSRYHGDERSSHSRRSRSPPLRRSPRGGRSRGGRSSPSPRSSGSSYPGSSSLRTAASHARDARDDIIRREEQRRDLMERRLGADPYYRDGSRQVMMDDRRFADRYQEIAARRQLELEQNRREQEMARRVQEIREREAREREIRERQLAEQERLFKERERVMREREYRERQRREQLEKELRERDQREKELRERERRLREQHVQEIREREMKVARERELRERELQAQVQRERELQEKEQRLLQEHQRIQKEKQLYEEQQRRLREEAERQAREREREAREREARERDRKLEAERERRLREEKERERRERERVAEEKRLQLERAAKLEHEREQQKRKQDEMKWEREQSRMLQQQRLGKRASGGGYQDSPGYDMAKRQSVHDIRGTGGGVRGASASGGGGGGMDLFDLSSSVFSRLDQQKQVTADGRSGGMQNVSGMMQGSGGSGGGKNSSMADSYSRRSAGDASGVGGGGYRQGSGGYGGGVGGAMGRERHMETGVTYPIPSLNKSVPTSSPGYQKSSGTIGGGVTVLQKGGGLSRQNHDIISAALANIQKSVSSSSSISNQMRMPGSSPIQQMSSAAHMSAGGVGGDFGGPVGGQVPAIGGVARQMMGGGGGMGGMAKPPSKLPPEGERYNRRFSRPPHGPRQANMKRF